MTNPFELLYPYFRIHDINEGIPREEAVLWLRASGTRVPLLIAWLLDELRGAHPSTPIRCFGWSQGAHYHGFRRVAFLREFAVAFPGEERTHRVLMRMLTECPKGRAVQGVLEVCLLERLHGALWDWVRVRTNPNRGAVVDALSTARWLTAEQVAPLLEDHKVRGACGRALEALLPESLPEVHPLTKHANAATRKEATRIVRLIKPNFGRDGIAVARDAETVDVLVDGLQEIGDAHGALIALTRAIESAPPKRALELSAALAAYADEHGGELWYQQGGWPVRDDYRGRQFLCLDTGFTYRGKKNRGQSLLARMQRFLERFAADVELDDHWTFSWTHPGSDVLLPFQEANHYPHCERLRSELSIRTDTGFTWVRFKFPFEQRTSAFLVYLREIEVELGPLLKRDWSVMSPNAAGGDVVSRRGYLPEIPPSWSPVHGDGVDRPE